jgi:hypothetical protein
MNPDIDLGLFSQNRAKFPPEKLLPYAGQHVAWALSGQEILAHAPDLDGLLAEVQQLGLPPCSYVLSYVPGDETCDLGGGCLGASPLV